MAKGIEAGKRTSPTRAAVRENGQAVRVPSESGGSLVGVSETALGAAEMRAAEGLRPDRLFDDPYAAAFVAAAPQLFPDIPSIADEVDLAALIEASITGVAVRTRFYDDYLSTACAAGCRQVVLLAAGLDTRAFRLDWPEGVRVSSSISRSCSHSRRECWQNSVRRQDANAGSSRSTFAKSGPVT
jgi:hypothetical protein